jgi:Cysteine-rich CPCC
MTQEKRYPCPCCGYLVHNEPPGSYDICPICFWEDDLWHVGYPLKGGGANHPSLLEGQQNYLTLGACEERLKPYVRLPLPDEQRIDGWRRFTLATDNVDESENNLTYIREQFLRDPLSIYYWCPTYWRQTFKSEQEQAQHPTTSSDR